MPIRFRCSCGKIIKVKEQLIGRRITCPDCNAQLIVPRTSTVSEAEGWRAEAVPPPEPAAPQPPRSAFDLELESEPSPPGGPAEPVEEVEELTESDAVEEVEEVEEVAPESEVSEVEPVPEPSAAAEPALVTPAPAGPATGNTCPNCGVAVAPGEAICRECGANIIPKKAPEKKATGIANVFQSLREHKRFPLIAAAAAVVLIAIVAVIIMKVRKPKAHPPLQPVAQAKHRAEPGKTPEKAAPAQPTPHWPGFSEPALVERDQILKVGQELAAFVDKNHQPPAALDDVGATAAECAEFDYVGAQIAALARFRAMTYEAKPSEAYIPYMLFSDATARPVPAPQIPFDLLKKTESGWLTAADAALLAQTAPMIRVANVRFASLGVALDDQPAVTIPRGTDQETSFDPRRELILKWTVIPAAAGAHQITFTAGEKKDSLQADLKPGIVYTFFHPWQADLPWIPVRQYRAAIAGQTSDFSVDQKEGYAIKSLKGPNEIVNFGDGDGRTAISSDFHTLAARITREKADLHGAIEGLPEDNLIHINKTGRLEAGVVKFAGDIAVTFRKTALGTLRCEELPNTYPAVVALPEGGLVKPTALGPATTRRGRGPRIPARGPRGGRLPMRSDESEGQPTKSTSPTSQAEMAAPAEAAPQLAFPPATFTLLPDCQAIAGALSSAAPAAVELLLQRAQLEMSPAELTAGRGTPSGGETRGLAPRGRRGGLFEEGQMEEGPRLRGGRGATARTVEIVDRPLHAQEVPAPLVYGTLALYGNDSTFRTLSEQCEKLAGSPAYPSLLLALARSGGVSALTYLRTASDRAPAAAVIALCTIDDPAARNMTGEILANWTADDVTAAAAEWRVVAGPSCRIAFIEALAAANPALLEDVNAVNALMKLDAFTLERVLAERLEADLNRPPPTAEPAKAAPNLPPPKEPGRRRVSMAAKMIARRAASAASASASVRPPAPLSWIVLARFRNSATVARFVALLDSNDPTKRLHAVEALGEVRDPSLVPLLTALLQDREATVGQAAARALVEAPDAAVVAALDKAMDKDLLASAIVEQAPAIAVKAGPEATASLLAKMLTIAAKTAQAPAGAASAEEEAEPAAPPPQNPNLATPMTILGAISRLGLYSPEVKSALEAARDSPDPATRVATYRAWAQEFAGAPTSERSAAMVVAAVAALKDMHSAVRRTGIRLLSAAEPTEALPLLLPLLKDPEAGVRAAALSALPQTADDPRIPAAIISSLSDPNALVVAAAARAAAPRHDPMLGAAVISALNQAANKPAEPPAAERAGSRPGSARGRPAEAARGRPRALKPLSDQSVMLTALAEATGDLQPQGAAGALAGLLAYPQPEVRAAAVRALGKLKDATALNSVLSALQDKDPSVVSAAIGALGEFDAPEAAQAMMDTLSKETLAPELRRQILTHLVAHCADPNSAYASWAASAPPLKDSDLDILISMAPSATGDERAGLISLGTRYLADSRSETRRRAAMILANYADDEAIRTKLLNALEQDASGIGTAVAGVLQNITDDSMVDVPLLAYYKVLCESSAGGTPAPAPGPRPTAPLGPGAINAQRAAAPAATAPPPTRYAGLLKASTVESFELRAAIIDALGVIGGDHAAKALRTIADLEQRRNSEEMTLSLITAFENAKASSSAREICDFYVINPGPYRLEAISALARLATPDSTHVVETLTSLAERATTPRDVAAAAMDALDEIQAAAGSA